MTKRKDFLSVLETTLRATSTDHTCLCGWDEDPPVPEPDILGFSTFLQMGAERGDLP